MVNEVWNHLEQRRGELDRHRENATRPARAFMNFKTTGIGIIVVEDPFIFECSFIKRPIFTYGASLDDDTALPDDPPRCTAGVYDWKQSANDYYTGAWLWFNVDTWSLVPDDFNIIFGLSFEGLASKDFIASREFPVDKLDINWDSS